MDFEFKLPDLGEGIVEGEVVKWLVKEGDPVTEDMPLLEVMTDKATVEITSPKNGKIGKILVKEGDIVAVEQVMVTIQVSGGSSKPAASHAPSPAAKAPASAATTSPAASAERSERNTNVQASPATRKLARELNVDLGLVQGTGPGGRLTNEDVENFAAKTKAPAPAKAPTTSHAAAEHRVYDGTIERIPFRGLRKKIAENMTRSTHTAAHFSYVDTVDMTELVKLRGEWKKDAERQGAKLTYLPFIMIATIESLKQFPRFNASLEEDTQEIVLKKYYNLGVATATEKGLIVPVIKNCDQKSLLTLSKELADLTEKTREMKADLEELRGSSFTLTSLGALGGLFATPIINYPETAIMGIYQIKPTPVVFNGQVVVREIMYFSLSLDHRVIDGHEAAAFGNVFKKCLEEPKSFFKLS